MLEDFEVQEEGHLPTAATWHVASDGSGLGVRGWPALPRCGWAWVLFDISSGEQLFVRRGTPPREGATVGKAELQAVVDLVLFLATITQQPHQVKVYIDNAQVQRGLARLALGRRPASHWRHQDLWQEAWGQWPCCKPWALRSKASRSKHTHLRGAMGEIRARTAGLPGQRPGGRGGQGGSTTTC